MVNYDKIYELSKETGKSLAFLSEKLGRSQNYLKGAKFCKTDMDYAKLRVLAKEFNTTIDYLTDKSDVAHPETEPKFSEIDIEILQKLQGLPNDTKKIVWKMIKAL